MCMRSTLGCGFLASLTLVLQLSVFLKHRRSARGAWFRCKELGGLVGKQACCWGWCRVIADKWHVYSCHIPVIFAGQWTMLCLHWCQPICLGCVFGMHGPMCAGSWLFRCFVYCLKVLNVNSTYDRHIPLWIDYMSDIISYNYFITVTSKRNVFLLCKFQYSNAHCLCNGYMHWNPWKQSFWHVPGICKDLEYVRHIPKICLTYNTTGIPDDGADGNQWWYVNTFALKWAASQ